jgi:fluoride exporter
MPTILWVALGGAVGSVGRYLISAGFNGRAHPWGTVLVNVVGSLALGFLIGRWGFDFDSPTRLGLTVGLLGGFTTFSAFTADAVRLWEGGRPVVALSSVVVSVGVGIVAAVAGLIWGRA